MIKRPGVDNFLKKMGEIYEVVVFTASLSKVSVRRRCTLRVVANLFIPQYADPVLDKLDIHHVVAHRLFRESCYNHRGNYVKVSLSAPFSRSILSLSSAGVVGSFTTGASDLRYNNHRQLASVLHFPPQ